MIGTHRPTVQNRPERSRTVQNRPGRSTAADITDRASLEQVNFRLKYRTELSGGLWASGKNSFSSFLAPAAWLHVQTDPGGPPPCTHAETGTFLRSPSTPLSSSLHPTEPIGVYRARSPGPRCPAAASLLLYLRSWAHHTPILTSFLSGSSL